jgi:hypothetical protein
MPSRLLFRATLFVALAMAMPTATLTQMVHGSAVPSWAPTYQTNRSTFLMACNNTGLFNPDFGSKWGIVDYDWSNMRFGAEGWTSSVPMDCQEKLATQAAATKAVDSGTKVFVYRNMVKALPCASSFRLASAACRSELNRFAGGTPPSGRKSSTPHTAGSSCLSSATRLRPTPKSTAKESGRTPAAAPTSGASAATSPPRAAASTTTRGRRVTAASAHVT